MATGAQGGRARKVLRYTPETFDDTLRLAEFGGPLVYFKDLPAGADPAQLRAWITYVRDAGSRNAVFMDTTTIYTAWRLLQEGAAQPEPAALMDLSNVVSAIIANDTIFHFKNSTFAAEDLNEFFYLHNDPVFIPIDTQPHGSHVGSFLRGHWLQSMDYAEKIARGIPELAEDQVQVQSAWEHLLGGPVPWQAWEENTEDFQSRQYGEVSDPEDIFLIATELFRDHGRSYTAGAWQNKVADFILECNCRSGFNTSVAKALDMQYVANSYRLPFQEFLAKKGWASRQFLLRYVDGNFRKLAARNLSLREPIEMPLFMSAILAKTTSLTEFRECVAEFRSKAMPFRQKVRELEIAVRNGNLQEQGRIVAAMSGSEGRALWQWLLASLGLFVVSTVAAHDVGGAATHVALETGAELTVAPAVGAGAELCKHLFQPRLRFIRSIAESARTLTDARDKIADLWGVPSLDDEYVKALNRVARL